MQISWDGGIQSSSSNVPSAQRSLFEEDEQECWAIIDDRVSNFSHDEILSVYEDEIATRDCLVEHGYMVDAIPSEQSYLDSFHGDRWSAYGASSIASMAIDQDEWRKISEACPQPAWGLGAE